ncbi:sigma-70 family RNA polymerase sigma factor [Hydrogenoanaerobacterium sp.]|uniref:RNA polymerase sigma factor n=1 Tax=Hydrogenoanaerobacterium sp. TaxID=2953763 RepID=UPI0028990A67|nr:sigma-70 family RNA polymerase sigma factor [Hydrogenoanaerobacterium sp.]
MDDEMIIDLYWERSESAISETSKKYGSYCRSIAYNILADYLDVEECENDTYVAAWNTIPPTRPKILKSFLGRLMRNIALDRYDYNKAQKRNNEFDILLSELGDCIAGQDTESKYESGYVAKSISDFLRSIDTQSRLVFIRRYWYSDSINDISVGFGMSVSKTKSLLIT